jgi:NADH dehydrogenase (ubiquinone) Fe-S protein 3
LSSISQIKKLFPFLTFYSYSINNLLVRVKPEEFLLVLEMLKLHSKTQYALLTTISGVDYPFREHRFCVVYELLSVRFNSRLRLKVFVDELLPLQSIVSIFPSSTWWEREIWDLFGVFFTKNNELKRILTDYGFEGHPLRKDFPLSGYTETRYADNLKRVSCEPIEHSQEFRLLNVYSNWSNQILNSSARN